MAWGSPEIVILNEKGGQKLACGNPASWCGGQKCGHLRSLESRRREGGRLCPAEEWEDMAQ